MRLRTFNGGMESVPISVPIDQPLHKSVSGILSRKKFTDADYNGINIIEQESCAELWNFK